MSAKRMSRSLPLVIKKVLLNVDNSDDNNNDDDNDDDGNDNVDDDDGNDDDVDKDEEDFLLLDSFCHQS